LGESGSKEVLISQLRAEILELKQNEREYFDLSAQLKKLEQRYAVLQEDKVQFITFLYLFFPRQEEKPILRPETLLTSTQLPILEPMLTL